MTPEIKKLREEEIEKHYQMGYAFVDEEDDMDGGTRLDFYRSESPEITVYIREER